MQIQRLLAQYYRGIAGTRLGSAHKHNGVSNGNIVFNKIDFNEQEVYNN